MGDLLWGLQADRKGLRLPPVGLPSKQAHCINEGGHTK